MPANVATRRDDKSTAPCEYGRRPLLCRGSGMRRGTLKGPRDAGQGHALFLPMDPWITWIGSLVVATNSAKSPAQYLIQSSSHSG